MRVKRVKRALRVKREKLYFLIIYIYTQDILYIQDI